MQLYALTAVLALLMMIHSSLGWELPSSAQRQTLRPLIGIMTQPDPSEEAKGPSTRSYVASAYVKWIEAAGARAVPIYQTTSYVFEVNL